ncbi:DUF2147 domain-containing protein [Bradyrhizobium manausense]|uniref:DUF2147 domain-containing protein n=1 Tax=Bradyrhizobium manausense TaxID=989370 RepID=UPI001BA8395B|nr:DUF2147 domain-containing protein [Bradyrhizobium manausense]MBR0791912.1 DUF2147 domain-containing protein [Bradyrhizobium manausense]
MNKIAIAFTAVFLASTAVAHAGNAISFQIDGQRVRIERPRNCTSLDCLTIATQDLSNKQAKPATTTAPPAPAPVQQQPAQQTPAQVTAPAAPPAPPAPVAVAAAPTVDTTTQPSPVAPPAPVAVAPAPAPVAAAPAPAASTPIGVWATEENKGNVRVEQCGTNLCGYADKTNDKILINMKPDGAKWSGRIHDPNSGRNYDSTIAMKGPNSMRVQGCAFGGLFCGGQTWKRVS